MSWLQVMAMKYPLASDMESNLVRASCLLRPGVGNPVISPVSSSGGIKGIPNLDDAFQTPDFISAKPLWFPVCPLPSGLPSSGPLRAHSHCHDLASGLTGRVLSS